MKPILSEQYGDEKQFNSQIDKFLSKYSFGKILHQSNFRKEKGFSCLCLFKFIFLLVFSGKNLYHTLQADTHLETPKKDAIYRFLNSCRYNWRKFLLILSSKIIRETIEPLNSRNWKNVLILDDSLYSRSRSKAVELLANIYDHVEHRYVRGFRMLTLGWSDGTTFVPVAFSLLSSKEQRNRYCEANQQVDKRSIGHKRRLESTKKSTEVMFDLLRQAQEYGVQARYLLFDSWFSFPSVIRKVREHHLHVICRLKSMKNVFYSYKGEEVTLDTLYKDLLKKRGRAKILANAIVGIGTDLVRSQQEQAKRMDSLTYDRFSVA